jgi:predicted Zn-dependent protease with MMP-like domain
VVSEESYRVSSFVQGIGDLGLSIRMTHSAFEELVAKALEQLPDEFAKELDNVAVVVEGDPEAEVLVAVGLDPEEDDLFGLYQGIPLTERDSRYSALPDRIAIYRRPILRACTSRRQVIREVRDTVLHELGHHLGMEEEDMPF